MLPFSFLGISWSSEDEDEEWRIFVSGCSVRFILVFALVYSIEYDGSFGTNVVMPSYEGRGARGVTIS